MTFYEKMRLVCLAIPRGRVATYGQIAMLCGKPKNSRKVGFGLRSGLAGEGIPAFRIVNGRGELSGAAHNSALGAPLPQPRHIVAVAPGEVHCYCMLPYFPEAREDFNKIVEILKK